MIQAIMGKWGGVAGCKPSHSNRAPSCLGSPCSARRRRPRTRRRSISADRSSLADALHKLLIASQSYHAFTGTDDDLDRIESLFGQTEMLAAPLGLSLPAFERNHWSVNSVEYIPLRADQGKTYPLSPVYLPSRRGNLE